VDTTLAQLVVVLAIGMGVGGLVWGVCALIDRLRGRR
jgi:hypothetical protein